MKATRASSYGIGLAFALAGGIGVIVGLILAHKDFRLLHDGVATNATVTALTSRQFSKGTECIAFFDYLDASGVSRSAKSEVWPSEWEHLKQHGPIPILFVRDDPTETRVNLPYETKLYHDNGTAVPLFSLFISFVGLALIVAAYLDSRFPPVYGSGSLNRWWLFRHPANSKKFHKTY